MNKVFALAALLATLVLSFGLVGCDSDPHDTHILTSVVAPR